MKGYAYRHGHSNPQTPTYRSWSSMKARVKRKSGSDYEIYMKKGITVCERWLYFENFLEDMGVRPEKMTLDRIDSNKGYYKENCRWSTASTQARNAKTKSISGLRGVYRHRPKRKPNLKKIWRAGITIEGKPVDLGTFYTKEEAYEAYKEMFYKHFPGEILYE